ncbi:MAG TPA: hypothetical protein VEA79_00190 [Phenylobacterium sp.]|nr:hypothetical protein [Phenylobacterium sp.]
MRILITAAALLALAACDRVRHAPTENGASAPIPAHCREFKYRQDQEACAAQPDLPWYQP